MKKKAEKQDHEFCNTSVARKYIAVLNSIEHIRAARHHVLLTHFNELCTYNIDGLEDREAVIKRIVNKDLAYPGAFLASSLGFNRMTWHRDYEKILSELGMYKRPKFSTLRNMLQFEKLKWLVIRLHEKRLKRKDRL